MGSGSICLTWVLLLVGCGGSETIVATPADGQAPVDAGDAAASGGNGLLGAACSSDNQCAGSLCLGGAFAGGYCSSPVSECDPGAGTYWCGDAGQCKKTGAVDVDGGTIGEYCLEGCNRPTDCRPGYECCAAQEYPLGDAAVCAPPSFCADR